MDAELDVAQIMTKEVITVNMDDSVSKVRDIFEENMIHHVVVTDAIEIKGIISKNDILRFLMKAYSDKSQISMTNLKAHEIMTANPLYVEADDTIGLAADIILSNRLHCLPVTENGDLVGILTNHDLLKYCFK